jgi:hypothetical protein
MTSVIRRTRYGDTMFVSNPTKAERAMVLWATTHGNSLGRMRNLDHECIRIKIPGVINITSAPEEKNHEISGQG